MATLPGAVAGALVIDHVPRRAFDAVMAVMLLAIAVWLFAGSRREAPKPRPRGTLVTGGLLSVAVGFLSSFLGIGGGIIHVPLLVSVLGFPVHIATATSHFVLVFMSGAGAITHLVQGSYHVGHGLRRTIALSAGVIAGAQVGAQLSLRTSGPVIQRLLAVALLLLGLRLAIAS
jgi:uncharacterized protein